MSASQVARRMWTLFEPIHAVTYFAAEARAAFEAAGVRGFWRGYFAGRSAPLGRVTAAPVTASFYDMLAAAAAGLDCSGRVLAGANAALPVPADPVARLWQAATVLREHRGDGHFATLLAADVDGCESNVLRAGFDLPRETIQPLRGWTDEQWAEAAARLAARRLIDSDGTPTPAGAALRAAIEATTDAAAARPWPDQGFADDLAEVLYPIALACSAEVPAPNPVGAPVPKGPDR